VFIEQNVSATPEGLRSGVSDAIDIALRMPKQMSWEAFCEVSAK
jgi:hypothetical protein